jgi:hypothetical protein
MDIIEAHPHQLAPIVGSLGVGIMSSTTFSPASRSNSMIDGSQICFGKNQQGRIYYEFRGKKPLYMRNR